MFSKDGDSARITISRYKRAVVLVIVISERLEQEDFLLASYFLAECIHSYADPTNTRRKMVFRQPPYVDQTTYRL